MPSRKDIREAVADARAQQDTAIACDRADHCALASPLRELGDAALDASTPQAPRHHVALLENGPDALLARINLIRAARRSIDVQSFIYAQDDAGFFVLGELLGAARRGVKVRVLLDQLFSVDDVKLLAGLARAHVNFELRLYNPTFGEAQTGPVQFVAGIVCCFFRFNQRMHNKLLLVDGAVGVTGGRNYQNRYFDWDPEYNYRDRDILVAGPAAAQMQDSFDAFWRHQRSVPVAALRDVRRWVERDEGDGAAMDAPRLTDAARILDLSAQADNAALVAQRIGPVFDVGPVEYVSDLPNKAFESNTDAERDLTRRLQTLFLGARERIVLQTPYLVFSGTAQDHFRDLQERDPPPRVIVSTNSLASTDAFPVYALSHKYKRRYLREFGFEIHEYKPFPASAPIDVASTGALGREVANSVPYNALKSSGSGGRERDPSRYATESQRRFGAGSGPGRNVDPGPLPLERAGVRVGMHAKSIVIDDALALVGTHNFDPRSDKLNTESAVIVHDRAFAEALAANILHDTLPENAWTIARRPRPPVLSGVNYSLGKVFEALPLFDFWPFRYATSWEIKPGCAPLRIDDPGFEACYEPVGDFPEVDVPLKSIYTRVLTAFGAGLAPIL
nr:phospholipase D family protein [Chiayiivirga flava]